MLTKTEAYAMLFLGRPMGHSALEGAEREETNVAEITQTARAQPEMAKGNFFYSKRP
jgi:hypothetical protein